MAESVKISANLSKSVVQALKDMAEEQNISMTEVLRRSISTEKFLLDTIKRKGKILIEEEDKTMRQVLIR